MSTIKASKFQHPDSLDPSLSIDEEGVVHTNKLDVDELTTNQVVTPSLKHPNSPNPQIIMNDDGSVDVSGLSINNQDLEETISQATLPQEKALTPDQNDEYTLELEDTGKVLTLDDADGDKVVIVNVPQDSETDFEVGSRIHFYQGDEATIAITSNQNVSIKSPLAPGPYYFVRKYGEPQLRKRASNQWTLTENGLYIQSLFAIGGDEVFEELINGIIYRIHVFTTVGSSQAFEVKAGEGEVDYLIVGGGGSGASTIGNHKGGGGGAGGLIFNAGSAVSSGVYPVVIGAGAPETPDSEGGSPTSGTTGENSSFNSDVALGGGAGGEQNSGSGHNDGGSGGGGHYSLSGGQALQPSSASGGFGNSGGSRSSSDSGYGGGGAGTPGKGDGDSPADGRVYGGRWSGGDGLSKVIVNGQTYDFATIFARTAGEMIYDEAWFAGGAGGGENGSSHGTYGAGGKGGGGRGAYTNAGSGGSWGEGSSKGEDGLANTGGGGGGARGGIGGAGGSGVVLVRYRVG